MTNNYKTPDPAIRFKEINKDISVMIESLTKFHEDYSKKTNNINLAHVGNVAHLAKNIEEVLLSVGQIDENKPKYSK